MLVGTVPSKLAVPSMILVHASDPGGLDLVGCRRAPSGLTGLTSWGGL
jgi:hypothetical protein